MMIPSIVLEIGDYAFSVVCHIEDLRFEEGLACIRKSRFQYWARLKTLTFPARFSVSAPDHNCSPFTSSYLHVTLWKQLLFLRR
jgi:hypothetical protein